MSARVALGRLTFISDHFQQGGRQENDFFRWIKRKKNIIIRLLKCRIFPSKNKNNNNNNNNLPLLIFHFNSLDLGLKPGSG